MSLNPSLERSSAVVSATGSYPVGRRFDPGLRHPDQVDLPLVAGTPGAWRLSLASGARGCTGRHTQTDSRDYLALSRAPASVLAPDRGDSSD